jgi:hypothetical protein
VVADDPDVAVRSSAAWRGLDGRSSWTCRNARLRDGLAAGHGAVRERGFVRMTLGSAPGSTIGSRSMRSRDPELS